MTTGRRPMTTPDLEWLERAIKVWAKPAYLGLPSLQHLDLWHSLAEHLLGNWLTVEDAQVRELVEAAEGALSVLQFVRECNRAPRSNITVDRLKAALAPF